MSYWHEISKTIIADWKRKKRKANQCKKDKDESLRKWHLTAPVERFQFDANEWRREDEWVKRLQLLLQGRGPSCVSSASTPSGDRWSLESPAQLSPSSFSSYRSATGQNKLCPYNATKCIFTIGFFYPSKSIF